MHFFRLGLAAALLLAASTLAHAQTVIVRNVPIGETIEVFVNETKGGTGTVGANGTGRVTVDLRGATGAAEMDSRVYVDVCSKLHRIYIVNRNIQPPAKAEGCERREILGVFWVRQRSTLAIDAGSVIPTMLLRQGRYDPTAGKIRLVAPKGIVVFAAGGMADFANFVSTQCGLVNDCSGDSNVVTFTGGADLWLTNWLGVEGAYSKPNKITVEGAEGSYKFTDTFDAHLITAAGKIGIPVGRARMYGKGGALYHRATTSSAVTINEQQQTLRLKTEGWGWLAGGGIEVWTGRKFAIFGEVQVGKIKGEAVGDNLEGTADDRMTHFLGGFRVKIF
jgi:hypothetical protein